MKKKLLLAALLVICLSLVGYGTAAYFTAERTARNVITTGNVEIELLEMAVPENGGDPVPFTDVTGVMPGAEVSKIVTVKNTGSQSAYIRVKLEKQITLAQEGEADLSLVTCDINTVAWTLQDGWYYYNQPLAAGEQTQPLFTVVRFDAQMGNLYQNSTAQMNVQAQATQVANNGASVLEAAGWPAE